MPWNNLQYIAIASFIPIVYSNYLKVANADYILGKIPMDMSFMVGFWSKSSTQPHHRGVSIVSVKKD
ncbi:hypothetical protein Pint_26333 [Pistacia integerrima]|uniref:Uncharacterized protein n=1 Tax=Pistacia integerrima TaxID=434235 RepID=A0ACC0YEX1_9ROSI|nr:hypothetical protein Pint_26333 [Pistacia integerrima]